MSASGPRSPVVSGYRVKDLGHLVARFLEFLSSPPLDPGEVAVVERLLDPGERAVFLAQPAQDQRHGLRMALRLEDAEARKAALLHDSGKRHARLGVVGRVWGTMVALLRLPRRGRVAVYLNHGPVGARDLAEIGSSTLVVAYTRDHHGEWPAVIPPELWDELQRYDGVVVRGRRNRQDATIPRHGQ